MSLIWALKLVEPVSNPVNYHIVTAHNSWNPLLSHMLRVLPCTFIAVKLIWKMYIKTLRHSIIIRSLHGNSFAYFFLYPLYLIIQLSNSVCFSYKGLFYLHIYFSFSHVNCALLLCTYFFSISMLCLNILPLDFCINKLFLLFKFQVNGQLSTELF